MTSTYFPGDVGISGPNAVGRGMRHVRVAMRSWWPVVNRMTQRAVAERCGVSVRTLQRWESGKCMPTAEQMAAWGTAVGVEVSYSPTGFRSTQVDRDWERLALKGWL